MTDMTAIALGVHVLDVLVRPVEAIPEGQGGALVDEIRMTAAGSAGGTALILAKLGAKVRSAGAIGHDPLGDMLCSLLERDGVDTALLLRRDGVQTSASLLPNDEQVLGFTGASDLVAGCRALIERGVGCVAATCGAEGVVVVDAESVERVPAFAIDVVDTTGCGDAFSAGFLRGLAIGRDRRGA